MLQRQLVMQTQATCSQPLKYRRVIRICAPGQSCSGRKGNCRTNSKKNWQGSNFEGRGYGSFGSGYGGYGKWGGTGKQVDPIEFWKDMIDLQEDIMEAVGGYRGKRSGSGSKSRQQQQASTGEAMLAADFDDSDENQYVVYADIPGLTREDVKVQVDADNNLIISGERVRSNDKPSERFFGKFKRTFVLPQDADIQQISASVDDGVLTVTIKRIIETKPEEGVRDIPIM
eukprot:TRINITY_DN985_c0_g3_i1.p1 TRINITY_DN985_c0_g3~~TRINITY_DN985_c0_g3_i1.p1  ORF type:complete len:229 (-),score=31.05 TRINITY_DN985_c0_g3_i1:219-905(-)